VLFVDQSDVGLYPPIGSEWSTRGKQQKVRTKGKNRKVFLFGALDAKTGGLYAGFWPRKNSDAFIEFLSDLLAAIPEGRLYLVLDNYGVHKSKKTRQFLATAGQRISMTFLPTYSPWLNRIEETWRVVKGRAGRNQWRDSVHQLQDAYLDTMTAMGATTLRRVHTLPDGKE